MVFGIAVITTNTYMYIFISLLERILCKSIRMNPTSCQTLLVFKPERYRVLYCCHFIPVKTKIYDLCHILLMVISKYEREREREPRESQERQEQLSNCMSNERYHLVGSQSKVTIFTSDVSMLLSRVIIINFHAKNNTILWLYSRGERSF